MKLDSTIIIFSVIMIALIITILTSFILPINQTIAIPLLIIGSWFVVLGITQETKPHELTTTTPTTYTIYGGLMLTISLTYLAYINIADIRIPILIFISGITLTIILSHIIETHKKISH